MTDRLPPDLPRFLPTLTEVVQPDELESLADVAAPPHQPALASPIAGDQLQPQPTPAPSPEALVEQVMQRVTPLLQARLRAVTESWLQEQLRGLEPALWEHLKQAVQADVVRAVAQTLEAQSPRSPD